MEAAFIVEDPAHLFLIVMLTIFVGFAWALYLDIKNTCFCFPMCDRCKAKQQEREILRSMGKRRE
jgi:hypothetical protein